MASTRVIVEALADGVVEDPETVQRYLRTAQRDVQSLTLLIDDLFDLAQMDAGGLKLERRPTSIADLISDTLESFTVLARQRDVILSGGAEPGVDPALVDARQIGRVLANLIGNALRHTPPGGAVTLRAWPVAGRVQVEVADTGEGIPSEDLPRVFERFYRGEKSRSRATGGSGLGLAIAKAIVEAHAGQIWVESQPGEGARFSFFLPRA
jgi:signal transduction histidine kinase